GVEAKNGFDFIGGIPGFQEIPARTVEDKHLQIGMCPADPGFGCETLKGPVYQVGEQNFELPLNQDADNPQRGAAQAEGVLVPGRDLADAEEAGEGVELVGERDSAGPRMLGKPVAGEA